MSILDEKGNWIKRNGNPIPKKNIKTTVKKRDAVVERIAKKGLRLQKQMQEYKNKIIPFGFIR